MIWADVSFQKFLILKLHVETKLLDLNPSISEEFVTNPLIGFGNIFKFVSNKQNHHQRNSLVSPPLSETPFIFEILKIFGTSSQRITQNLVRPPPGIVKRDD